MCHPPRLPSLTFFVAFHLLIVLLTKFSLLLLVLQLPWKTTKGHPPNLACAGLNIMAMLNRFLKKMCSQETRLHRFPKICSWQSSYLCLFVMRWCKSNRTLPGPLWTPHRWRQREQKKTREVRKVDRKWKKHLETHAHRLRSERGCRPNR